MHACKAVCFRPACCLLPPLLQFVLQLRQAVVWDLKSSLLLHRLTSRSRPQVRLILEAQQEFKKSDRQLKRAKSSASLPGSEEQAALRVQIEADRCGALAGGRWRAAGGRSSWLLLGGAMAGGLGCPWLPLGRSVLLACCAGCWLAQTQPHGALLPP